MKPIAILVGIGLLALLPTLTHSNYINGIAVSGLLFLVAIGLVEQIVGEVIPQGHGRVDVGGVRDEAPVLTRHAIVGRQAVAFRLAAGGGVERAIAANQAVLDGVDGLVGLQPAGAIVVHGRHAEAVGVRAVTEPRGDVDPVELAGRRPRPIQMPHVGRRPQPVVVAEMVRAAGEQVLGA